MPGRIIALYVILCLRVLVNGVALVKAFPPATSQAALTSTVATFEFSSCLFMLIALYQRKRWVPWVFRAYIALAMPLSLFFMWITAIVKQKNGEAMAWNAFVGGVIAAIGLAVFSWYVGRGPALYYLHSPLARSTEPPLLVTEEQPNKALEPTTTAVTSPAAQEPRQP